MVTEISVATKEQQDQILQKLNDGGGGSGKALFDSPGTYEWTCPVGVDYIKLTMFGGGGSGSVAILLNSNDVNRRASGGWGGAYVAGKRVKVTPGTKYSIVVGAGGDGVNVTGAGASIDGKPGQPTSAFGITCQGGRAGSNMNYANNTERATGNNVICSKGTAEADASQLGAGGGKYKLGVLAAMRSITSTPYGFAGASKYVNEGASTGGGAGYGNGGDANVGGSMPPGAGSGGCVSLSYAYSANGGHGIVFIEW